MSKLTLYLETSLDALKRQIANFEPYQNPAMNQVCHKINDMVRHTLAENEDMSDQVVFSLADQEMFQGMILEKEGEQPTVLKQKDVLLDFLSVSEKEHIDACYAELEENNKIDLTLKCEHFELVFSDISIIRAEFVDNQIDELTLKTSSIFQYDDPSVLSAHLEKWHEKLYALADQLLDTGWLTQHETKVRVSGRESYRTAYKFDTSVDPQYVLSLQEWRDLLDKHSVSFDFFHTNKKLNVSIYDKNYEKQGYRKITVEFVVSNCTVTDDNLRQRKWIEAGLLEEGYCLDISETQQTALLQWVDDDKHTLRYRAKFTYHEDKRFISNTMLAIGVGCVFVMCWVLGVASATVLLVFCSVFGLGVWLINTLIQSQAETSTLVLQVYHTYFEAVLPAGLYTMDANQLVDEAFVMAAQDYRVKLETFETVNALETLGFNEKTAVDLAWTVLHRHEAGQLTWKGAA